MVSRKEKAKALFMQGYNCSQSVTLAFSDMLGLDEKTLSRISCSFGGGMGRLREVCGAVSGMLIVAGLLYGYEGPESGKVKNDHYARIQELALKFEEQYGSIVCREMLGLKVRHDTPQSAPRTSDFYKKRPCPELIGAAAEILEEYISKHGKDVINEEGKHS